MHKIGKKRKFDIIVQETNIFMPGYLGWLLKNNKTIPVNTNHQYIATNFEPTLEKLFKMKHFILIYPEEEMWFNYRKIRPLKRGAYQYAEILNVPVISCFTKIIDTDILDNEEFNKTIYELNVLGYLYPDKDISPRVNSINMLNEDYTWKKRSYEEAYNKSLDYTFSKDDIAGYRW